MSSARDDGLNLSHQYRSSARLMMTSPHHHYFPSQAPSLQEEGSRYSTIAHRNNNNTKAVSSPMPAPMELGLRSVESLGYYAAASAHAANRLQRDITRLSSAASNTTPNAMVPLRSVMELENEIRGLEEMHASSAKERDESVLTTLQHMGAFLPPRPKNTSTTPATKKYRRSKHGMGNGGEGDIALSAAYARSLKLSAEFNTVVSERQDEVVAGKVGSGGGGPIQDTLEALLRSDEKSLEQSPQRIQEESDIQHSLLAALDRLVQAKIKQVSTGFDFEQRCGNPFEEPLVAATTSSNNTSHHHLLPSTTTSPQAALASTRSKVVEGNSRGDSNGNLHSTDADLHARISKASAELAALKKRRAMVDEDNYRASSQLTQLLRKFHSGQ